MGGLPRPRSFQSPTRRTKTPSVRAFERVAPLLSVLLASIRPLKGDQLLEIVNAGRTDDYVGWQQLNEWSVVSVVGGALILFELNQHSSIFISNPSCRRIDIYSPNIVVRL